jgi:hypothetical protein
LLSPSFLFPRSFLFSDDEALILLRLGLKIGQGSTSVVDADKTRVELTLSNPALNPFLTFVISNGSNDTFARVVSALEA